MRFVKNLNPIHNFNLGLPSRKFPRPEEFRQENYEASFDRHVLAYDAVQRDGEILLICPPLLNNQKTFKRLEFFEMPSGRRVEPSVNTFNRFTRIRFPVGDDTYCIVARGEFGEYVIQSTPNMCDRFAGLRVGVTVSKNNDPTWLADWARFHARTAGMEAFLLYDNNSTVYDPDVIFDHMKDVGLKEFMIVKWPYKWGPIGFLEGHRRNHWDSNFGQLGMFEHARWTYLEKARSILNCDADELVCPLEGDRSIFEAVETDPNHYKCMKGLWVEALRDDRLDGTAPRHAHFTHTLNPPAETLTKWACVPGEMPSGVNFGTHVLRNTRGNPFRKHLSEDFVYFHFRGLTTSWKPERSSASQKQIIENGQSVTESGALRAAFERAGMLADA
ncbi:MAG: hypothetical protein CMI67_10110 [Pelagibaca sp.]|nr:hypothetical protein [Pelagibaca sp.]